DSRVRYVTVPGTEQLESALVVERPSGTTLIVNDVIWNVAHRSGIGGWLLRKFRFTGDGPRIPPFVVRKSIKDPRAFRRQLELWAGLRDLRRIVVSHGEIVTKNAPGVLRELSARLAA